MQAEMKTGSEFYEFYKHHTLQHIYIEREGEREREIEREGERERDMNILLSFYPLIQAVQKVILPLYRRTFC